MVIALTDLITKATEKDLGGDLDERIAKSTNDHLAAIRSTQATVHAAEVKAEPAISGAKRLLIEHKEIKDLTPAESRRLQQFSRMFSHQEQNIPQALGIFPDTTDHTNEIRHFLSCLTAPETRMESIYQNDHTSLDGKTRKITLIASHMMDLAPTYDQAEDGETLFRFQGQQIPAMQSQQANADGRMLYFVAYNPFRDHWRKDPDAAPGHALAIVKDAYENHGAFGVKVYPPSTAPTGSCPCP